MVVARHFAIEIDAPRNQVHQRMKYKECFDQLLDCDRPVVVALDMGEFMRKDLLQLTGVQLADQRARQQNARLPVADGARRYYFFREEIRDSPVRGSSALQIHDRIRRNNRLSLQTETGKESESQAGQLHKNRSAIEKEECRRC